jgi:predicted Zn-dependent protease
VAYVSDSSEAEVRVANNTVTTNGQRRGRSVTVVIFDERADGVAAGVASRSGDVDIADLVRAARDDARHAPAASDASPLVGGRVDADHDAPVPETSLDIMGEVLDSLRELTSRAELRGITMAGFFSHALETTTVGTSAGSLRRFTQPTGSVQVVARSDGGHRSTWRGLSTPQFVAVPMDEIEAQLYQRLEWAQRSVEIPAGRYETIMSPSTVADMMAYLYFSTEGPDAVEGRTVFSRPGGGTRIGERISSLPFSVYSDPLEPGIECRPFVAAGASSSAESVFDNALDIERTDWIREGVINDLRFHRAGAREHGRPRATPGINNIIVDAQGSASLEDMIASTERGLLLNTLWYIRSVDPATLLLTGLTRDGVYLVEDGRVVGQVNNFRFNESPLDLLTRATEAGRVEQTLPREFDEFYRARTCPIRIPDFNMSSVSPAS